MISLIFPISINIIFFCLIPTLTLAQTSNENFNVRNVFPGRRVGGGTRAECASRLLVHLVPKTSVYVPDNSKLVALVKGPSHFQKTATTKFISINFGTNRYQFADVILQKTLPSTEASIYLIKSPDIEAPLAWESYYNCQDKNNGEGNLFDFVKVDAPPALSLLLNDPTPVDNSFALNIKWLSIFCNSTISTQELINKFELDDINTSAFPLELPVYCMFN